MSSSANHVVLIGRLLNGKFSISANGTECFFADLKVVDYSPDGFERVCYPPIVAFGELADQLYELEEDTLIRIIGRLSTRIVNYNDSKMKRVNVVVNKFYIVGDK